MPVWRRNPRGNFETSRVAVERLEALAMLGVSSLSGEVSVAETGRRDWPSGFASSRAVDGEFEARLTLRRGMAAEKVDVA